jgi:D-inositol-3-phosphate glycosyltransferase
MRIALVSEHASPLAALGGVDAGGQNVHVAALACALGKLGHQVTVYTRRDSPSLAVRIPLAPHVVVEHIDAGPAKPIAKDDIYAHVPAFAAQLHRAFRRETPDVAHSHFWMSGLAALDAAKPLGIPVVHTFHALGVEKHRHHGAGDTSPGARIAQERRIVREADRIIATATAEVFELTRMGAAQEQLKIIPCGVDTELFTPDGSRELRRSDRMRIVALSRLVPRKGIDTVVKAIVDVPESELVIAGGGEGPDLLMDVEAQRLAALAGTMHVAGRVYWRGRVERAAVPELLRSADVVVCTPWYEPFGIVPLEAMACGVPVIVSSVGGLVDTVVDGITGYHIPARSPARLAGALDALRRDPALRAAMGRAGHERVCARYTWTRIASETIETYSNVRRASDRSAEAKLATGA